MQLQADILFVCVTTETLQCLPHRNAKNQMV